MCAPAIVVVIAASIAISACDRRADRPSFVERDSAGIRIAENTRPLWGPTPGWSIAEEPHLEIGGVEGAPGHDLNEVDGVVLLSNGQIAIANSGSHEIRIFNRTGELQATTGRKGEGPGEFGWLSELFLLPGDSLLAIDGRLRRLTVFTSDGNLARTARLEDVTGLAAPTPFALLDGNTLLARPGFSFGSNTRPGVYRDSVLLVRYDLNGRFVDSVGRYPYSEIFVYNDGSQSMAGTLPFGKEAHLAAAPGGFFFGYGAEYRIEQHSADGALVGVIGTNRPGRPVTARDVERLTAPEPNQPPEDAAFWRRFLDAIPLPSHFPPYADIIADKMGFVWVRDYAFPPDSAAPVWQVFEPNGRWLGELTLPKRLRVLRIERDEILGVWRDDLDVEHVRAYRLSRDDRAR